MHSVYKHHYSYAHYFVVEKEQKITEQVRLDI